MPRRTFSGREVAKVLVRWGFEPVGGQGSHRVFRYENDETGEARTVTVPVTHDPIREGTLREIADQAGAKDFAAFCAELDAWL
ncbi:type II toxin-antitoxin system HicA family toxin [Halobacteriales archaeon QS_1_68_20]|nr:MAG: type II toxin-antitoxin system HicA family toxin [Halobacteriales archaeon QS_1_68_20]